MGGGGEKCLASALATAAITAAVARLLSKGRNSVRFISCGPSFINLVTHLGVTVSFSVYCSIPKMKTDHLSYIYQIYEEFI